MQQHEFNVVSHEEEHKFNKSKRVEVVLRYKFVSHRYYRKEYEDKKLEERVLNFELQIHYVVEQEATTYTTTYCAFLRRAKQKT